MSQLPASVLRTPRVPGSKIPARRAASGPDPAPTLVVAGPVPVPAAAPVVAPPPPEPRDLEIPGPRKLVRPTLPPGALRNRRFSRHTEPALSWNTAAASPAPQESSHAESFYFQKQVQSQTPMVFVLEDGAKIEGCIEWYDRNSLKVRGRTRTLVFKSAIKYMYKLGDNG